MADRTFLEGQGGARPLILPEGAPSGFAAVEYYLGREQSPLEVAVVRAEARPSASAVLTLWKRRHGNRPSPLLLVILHQAAGGLIATLCGPQGDAPTIVRDLDLGHAERLARSALAEPNRHAAIRFLTDALGNIEADLPGLRNEGLLATHELKSGVVAREDWAGACERGRGLLEYRGRELVEALGFTVEARDAATCVLRARGTSTAVAVFLDENETYEGATTRFRGSSPVTLALANADADRLPYVILTRGPQIRLYVADKRIVGVGRKGRTETYIEANLALLPERSAGYLPLIFGADALSSDGTFEDILASSRNFAAELSRRLRERVYTQVVPQLAGAIARRAGPGTNLAEEDLALIYEEALFVLFRLVFIAYAEDRELLPYGTNQTYRDHALKTRAQRLAERCNSEEELAFDEHATDLWADVMQLFRAVDRGNSEWGVPAYDGGLFSGDPSVSAVGAAVDALELTNLEFGPALAALLVDVGDDGVWGAIDFRSLSVREFGTIYEGLLESSLAVAQTDLTVDASGTYLPARPQDRVAVPAGGVYLHNRSGARKATGSYFTKPFAVEHLLGQALEPALDDHLGRLADLIASGDEAAAGAALFDFRIADIAMGSGHFLVDAVDHIEARLSSFLATHPLPVVSGELERLRQVALDRLGDLGSGVEIEQAALIRRLVARRCIYGVDVNPIAVELARLALWIHTFVPGLPLSFLDRTLVCGNSLTGIGSLDEAAQLIEGSTSGPRDTLSLARDQIEQFLARARIPLERLGRIADATPRDIEEAREAQAEAIQAVEAADLLFDLAVAARLGEAEPLLVISDEAIRQHKNLAVAVELAGSLQAVHFPVAFPEVFLREVPGFDCIVGNPPWEEATVEELGFWALRYPGLKSMTQARQQQAVAELKERRPDLVGEYEAYVGRAQAYRRVLLAGPYSGMGHGDPDVYKAFCWRFWQLIREGGHIGVVLPRSALAASGSVPWRETVLGEGEFADVTMLLNNRQWIFEDVHPQYTIGLISIRKGRVDPAEVRLIGPFNSQDAYDAGAQRPRVVFPVSEFRTWSSGAAFPLLPSAESGEVFLKLRRHPRLDADEHPWRARAVAELHATNDKHHMILDPPSTDGLWPVYKGASFDIWNHDTGEYYAWADPDYICDVLQQRRQNQARLARSVFSELPAIVISDRRTLPCRFPRIAFRDVTNRTNARTLIAALVPPDVVLTNKGPYFIWPRGDARDQAFLLGVMCSIPLDWYARRWVELNMNFHVLYPFPIPAPSKDAPLRRRVEEISGRLAAVDDRYAEWAAAVGVPVASVTEDEKDDLIAELDAAVSLLYGLDEPDVQLIFETFHVGWDYARCLEAVLKHYRRLSSLA